MSLEQSAREYLTCHGTIKEVEKRMEKLKPVIRTGLNELKTIGGQKYINIEDQSISLRFSKPSREVNKEALILSLKKNYPKIAKFCVTEKKVFDLDENVLQNFILTGDIPKEFLSEYIIEKERQPSIIVGKPILDSDIEEEE